MGRPGPRPSMRPLLFALLAVVCVAHGALLEETPQRIHLTSSTRAQRAATAVLKIGTTHIAYGPLVGWGRLLRNTYHLFLERVSTYTIGSQTYAIELISYLDDMDPSDGNTTVALVERLVQVDKVDLLISPYSGNALTYFILTAETLGVPCINIGSFDIAFYPPSLFYWTVNTMPSLATLGYQCAEPLVAKGAGTFVFLAAADSWANPSSFIQAIVYESCKNAGLEPADNIINVTQADLDAPWNLRKSVFDPLKAIDPDVIVFEFGQQYNIAFIDEMRQSNYNPRGYIVWGTGSYPEVRMALEWKTGHSLISEAYSPELAYDDPFWGGTAQYNELYNSTYNTASAFADANLAAGLSLLDSALRNTLDISPASLRTALLQTDIDTVVGHISFVNGSVSRPLYCFQMSEDARRIFTVWPKTVPSRANLTYPAVVTYPKGFFSSNSKSHLLAKILGGTLGSVFVLLVIGVAVAVCYFKKYHLVLVPKNTAKTSSSAW